MSIYSHDSIMNEGASLTFNVNYINADLYKGQKAIRLLKKGIWVYILLLIFEGALRKWIFPGLATPLIVVRDPVAIWLLIQARRRHMLPMNFSMFGMIMIGLVSIFTAIFFGHGNMIVALYGARILLIHFPLIFVIGNVFTREDVIRIGRRSEERRV